MNICIGHDVLGNGKCLAHDTESGHFSFLDSVPKGSWLFGKPVPDTFNVRELFSLARVEIETLPSGELEKYTKILKTLYPDNWKEVEIDWGKFMHKQDYIAWVKELLELVRINLNSEWCEYYTKYFCDIGAALDMLDRCSVNVPLVNKYMTETEHSGVKSSIASFLPTEGETLTKQVRYSRASTTGRVTVVDGPQILTLPKTNRDILKSRYEDGYIVMLDYKSMEARLALDIIGKTDTPKDIYAFLNGELFGGKLDRQIVKETTLTRMYGGAKDIISSKTGLVGQLLDDVFNAINEYFMMAEVTEQLKIEAKSGYITNLYGRPIKIDDTKGDHALYNYYIQSSAADAALLGFRKIIYTLASRVGTNIKPILILHDAIFLDVPKNSIKELKGLIEEAGSIEKLNSKYLMSLEVISGPTS